MRPGQTIYVAQVADIYLFSPSLKDMRDRATEAQRTVPIGETAIHCTRLTANTEGEVTGAKIHINGVLICPMDDLDAVGRILDKMGIDHDELRDAGHTIRTIRLREAKP